MFAARLQNAVYLIIARVTLYERAMLTIGQVAPKASCAQLRLLSRVSTQHRSSRDFNERQQIENMSQSQLNTAQLVFEEKPLHVPTLEELQQGKHKSEGAAAAAAAVTRCSRVKRAATAK